MYVDSVYIILYKTFVVWYIKEETLRQRHIQHVCQCVCMSELVKRECVRNACEWVRKTVWASASERQAQCYWEHFVLRAPMWNSLRLNLGARANLRSAQCSGGWDEDYFSHSACNWDRWLIRSLWSGNHWHPTSLAHGLQKENENFWTLSSPLLWIYLLIRMQHRAQERHLCQLCFITVTLKGQPHYQNVQKLD